MFALAVEAAICDPLDSDLTAAMAASEALLGLDQSLGKLLCLFRERAGIRKD